jgi:hypothetical protein
MINNKASLKAIVTQAIVTEAIITRFAYLEISRSMIAYSSVFTARLSLWEASYDFPSAATHRAVLAECGYFFAEAFFSNYFPAATGIKNAITPLSQK